VIINCRDWKRRTRNVVDEGYDVSQLNFDVASQVKELIHQIRIKGSRAISDLSLQFDGFEPELIRLKSFDDYDIDESLAWALKAAADNIECFAQAQLKSISDVELCTESSLLRQRVLPLESMAAYIPAGRFPLISTVLMTLIPAKVAGVKRRVALCANDSPEMLAAMSLAGATECLKIGGVQAVASAVFGFESAKMAASIEGVDCIVGPGNAYVAEAKKQLSDCIRIDSVAGPSELLVLVDNSVNLDWLIADMKAQAEHDPMAQSVVVSWQKDVLQQIQDAICSDSVAMRLSQADQICLVSADSKEQAINFTNTYAPEHLTVVASDFEFSLLKNYGSLFIGNNSAVAYGDYCSGPNHTLPTMEGAKVKGGLSVFDFIKIVTEQKVTKQGRAELGRIAAILADYEGLENHKKSVELRLL